MNETQPVDTIDAHDSGGPYTVYSAGGLFTQEPVVSFPGITRCQTTMVTAL